MWGEMLMLLMEETSGGRIPISYSAKNIKAWTKNMCIKIDVTRRDVSGRVVYRQGNLGVRGVARKTFSIVEVNDNTIRLRWYGLFSITPGSAVYPFLVQNNSIAQLS